MELVTALGLQDATEVIDYCGDRTRNTTGFTSKVSWLSSVGITYYILIHGFESAIGSFTLVHDYR